MATPATLTDVIERLRAEGQLTRNTGTNSIKSVRIELSAQTGALQEMLKIMRVQEERLKLGRAGQDTGNGGSDGDSDTPSRSPVSDTNPITEALSALQSLSMLGTIAAGAIGSALGVVTGQFKTIRVFFPKTVDKILKPISDFVDNFRNRMTALSASITTKLAQVGAGITTAISFVEGVFSSAAARINSLGMVGKAFTGTISYIYETLKGIVKVFVNVGKMIGGAFKTAFGLADAASSIMTPLKKFLGAIKSVAGAVGKLFVPLGVVLTLFDTINGIITGYTEGGILGALKGGITGFFNSLIFGPLDMLKDLVSWVLEKFGFENASEFLDSFSFAEMYTKIVDGVFGFVETAWNWLSEKFANLREALSQKWEEFRTGAANFGEWISSKLADVWEWLDIKFGNVASFISDSWNTLTGGVTSIGSWIWEKVSGVWEWIEKMFDDLLGMFPSIDELRNALLDAMPDWMRRLVGAPERVAAQIVDEQLEEQGAELEAARDRIERSLAGENVYRGGETAGREEDAAIIAELSSVVEAPDPRRAAIQAQIDRLNAERNALIDSSAFSGVEANTSYFDTKIAEFQAELFNFRMGTPGFMDFGPGSLAMLHGIEAVVPRNTPAGDFLANNFDGDMNPIMNRIARVETAAIMQQTQSPTIVVSAPTVAPVNSNVTGPTNINNNRVTAIGSGSLGGIGLGRFAN
jgi:hypothetical protein